MKYIILSRPRSGTMMLGSMLGTCGGEWYHPSLKKANLALIFGNMQPKWYDYFDGIIVMYSHLPDACLPAGTKIIKLHRLDEVARIKSLILASSTSRWHHSATDTSVDMQYHITDEHIDNVLNHLDQFQGIENTVEADYEVTYEGIRDRSQLLGLCDFLGIEEKNIKQPTCVQSPRFEELIINAQHCENRINEYLHKVSRSS
jgi:LPS sulfotransferase NodH